jgi:hypothetical protein
MKIKYLPLLLLLAGLSVACAAPQETAHLRPAERYLSMVDDAIAATRAQVPAMTASAEQAATRLLEGGTVWSAGPQTDFQIEALGRAGGLMSLKQLKDNTPAKGDVVLYAAAALTDEDRQTLRTWKDAGVQAVVFSHGDASATVFTNSAEPGLVVDSGLCPVDTVMNAVNLWAWTGELVAAATRQGKMFTFYQSYGVPGGRDRGAKYSGKTIHDDMTIASIGAGVLAGAYLDAIERSILALRDSAGPVLTKAAAWANDADGPVMCPTIGHMFPAHFQDARAPQLCTFIRAPRDDDPIEPAPDEGAFVLYIGYQQAPTAIVEQAAEQGFHLLYVAVTPTPMTHDNVAHLNPGWAIADGCVQVPGYDIAILPPSGVINASIYWSLVAELCGLAD